jgi:hypothetical protein
LLVVGCGADDDEVNDKSGSAKSGLRTSISPVCEEEKYFFIDYRFVFISF